MKLTPPPITPGPWNVDPALIRVTGTSDITCSAGRIIAFLTVRDANEANARAIAALPKVLEALEDLLENLDETGLATMPGDTFENMRETIERAKDALLEAGYTITES